MLFALFAATAAQAQARAVVRIVPAARVDRDAW